MQIGIPAAVIVMVKIDFFTDGNSYTPGTDHIAANKTDIFMGNKSVKLTLGIAMIFISVTVIAQQQVSPVTAKADSLFFAGNWKYALSEYKSAAGKSADINSNALYWNRVGFCSQQLGDYNEAMVAYKKSLDNKPSAFVQQVVYQRMSKLYGSRNESSKALESLSKAIDYGFSNTRDMDTSKEYASLKKEKQFDQLKTRAMENAYPCMKDTLVRAFDFWVGEWDAYVTGTKRLAGHSLIQKASGECMILENWTSLGQLYEGKSINYVNTETGKWEQVWVGSEGRPNGNVHRFVNGEYKNGVMQFDFETTDAAGKKLVGKFSFFNQGANQVRQLSQTSADNGATWTTVYDFTYIRKK